MPHGLYVLSEGTPAERADIKAAFPELEMVSEQDRDRAVTAWATALSSSPWERMADVQFYQGELRYPLVAHINEITVGSLALADVAAQCWSLELDRELLVLLSVLHDIDKTLLYVPGDEPGTAVQSPAADVLPHGVLGALILHDAGFDEPVTSIVATHAGHAPFHGSSYEAMVLYYADYFSADHIIKECGIPGFVPNYQRHVGQ